MLEEGETAKNFKSDSITAEELLQILSIDWLESSVKQFIQKVQNPKSSLSGSVRDGTSVGGADLRKLVKTHLSLAAAQSKVFRSEATAQSRIENLPGEPANPAWTSSVSGISILLLDAENLKLNIHTETFLARLCKYSLQVKIAFANWRNPAIGKQDAELYERGYQLVHVPGGKNSADAKMIAFGASILQQYRTVKEVFVCSDDGILTHLCNQLQNQGLSVSWVRRQNHILRVENRNTGEVSHYSLAMEMEIPKSENFVQKMKDLIEAEQESITERLNKLTTVASLFQERCNLELNPNSSTSLIPVQDETFHLSQTAESPSTASLRNSEAACRQTAESTQSLSRKEQNSSEISIATININSVEVLEEVIVAITSKMAVESKRDYVSITKLKSRFQTQCKETADSIVKKLQHGSSLIKFIKSRPTLFNLALVGKEYEVKVLVSKSLS